MESCLIGTHTTSSYIYLLSTHRWVYCHIFNLSWLIFMLIFKVKNYCNSGIDCYNQLYILKLSIVGNFFLLLPLLVVNAHFSIIPSILWPIYIWCLFKVYNVSVPEWSTWYSDYTAEKRVYQIWEELCLKQTTHTDSCWSNCYVRCRDYYSLDT